MENFPKQKESHISEGEKKKKKKIPISLSDIRPEFCILQDRLC